MKLKRLIGKFIPLKFTREISELFGTTTLMEFATAMVAVFEPIFLYSIGFSLFEILVYYTIVYIVYFLIVPFAGKWIKSNGFEHCIMYSSFFKIFYYLLLFALSYNSWLIIGVGFTNILARAFFWPAYHCDFAMYCSTSKHGRAIGSKYVMSALIRVIGPIIGGFIAHFWGFGILFVIVAVLNVISHLFTFSTVEKFEPEPFSYIDCFKRLFAKRNRKKLLAYIGLAEEQVHLYFWPVFIFIIVGSVSDVGLIIGVSSLVLALVTLYIGRITDKNNKKAVLKTGTFIHSIVWLMRTLVSGGLGIFLIQSLESISRRITDISLVAITYKRAQDGHLVKKIVFFMMALILILVILVALLAYFRPEALLGKRYESNAHIGELEKRIQELDKLNKKLLSENHMLHETRRRAG